MTEFDPMLSLAHTLHSTPGSHAFVLGAGVSIASGVPSAWGVVTSLVGQIASQVGAAAPGPDAVEQWYWDRFARKLTYEDLLERLAPTQTERQQLLRQYFESPVDPNAHPCGPSLAHRSLARLVAAGAVRIIITLNFDRLMETALIEEGVQPVIASTPSQIATLAPLHTIKALVVHLHGDYLDPLSMKNTSAELARYQAPVETFLDRLLDDYGLVAVGWSAAYDPALRAAISKNGTRVFTGYFINPGPLSTEAADLVRRRNMSLVVATADEAVGRLDDAVAALHQRDGRHPLSLVVAVETAKRQLAGSLTAISLHDNIAIELAAAQSLAQIQAGGTGIQSRSIPDARAVVVEGVKVAAGLIAACAYWGTPVTDAWWIGDLASFTSRPRLNGLLDLLDMPKLAGTLLFHAAGVAAVAAGRYDLARHLLTQLTAMDDQNRTRRVRSLLSPRNAPTGGPAPSVVIFGALETIFVDHLALGCHRYETAWEEFEFLRLVADTLSLDATQQLLEAIGAAKDQVPPDVASLAYLLQGHPNEAEHLASSRERTREGLDNLSRAEGDLARTVPLGAPHLRCWEDFNGEHGVWKAIIADRLLSSPLSDPWRSVFQHQADWNADDDAVDRVVEAVSRCAGWEADRRSIAGLTSQGGTLKTYLWLDTGEAPAY